MMMTAMSITRQYWEKKYTTASFLRLQTDG